MKMKLKKAVIIYFDGKKSETKTFTNRVKLNIFLTFLNSKSYVYTVREERIPEIN